MVDRSILARATSSNSSPTPGYLYGEIVRMTYSSHEGCDQVVTYLLKRLRKPSGVVKLKVLNIFKQVCPKAQNGFKRAIQHRIEDVKDCLSFTGPPDPLCGDEIYVLVRGAAKEAIEAVYSNESLGMTGTTPAFENRITGFGSVRVEDDNPDHHSSTHIGGYNPHSSRPTANKGGYTRSNTTSSVNGMVGTGNCDPGHVTKSSWLKNTSDSIKSTASAVTSAVEAKVKNFRQSIGDTHGGDIYMGGRDGFGDTTTIHGCVSNRGPAPYWVINGQGGYGGPSDMNFHPPVVGGGGAHSMTPNSQQQQQPEDCIGKEENVVAWSSNANSSHNRHISPISLRADNSDEYLDNAIAAVCAPGGTRAVPSKDKLDAFMVKITLLDQSKVQDALLKLAETTDNDWRVQSKALSVLTHLIFDGKTKLPDSDVMNRNNEIGSCLLRICEQGHLKAPVKEKCAELLCLLGRNIQHEGGEDDGAAVAPVTSSDPSLLRNVDLLGGDFGDEEILTTTASLPKVLKDSGSKPESYINLFDNMVVKEPPPVVVINNSHQQPHQPPPSSSTAASSFLFMSQNSAVVEDIFQDTTTTTTSTSSSSGPNDESLRVGGGVPTTTANENLVDLISGQPISPSSSKKNYNNWGGLGSFHDRRYESPVVSMEIPIQAQVEIDTNTLLEMKSQIGNTETAAAQSSSVPVNVGMQQQHSSIAMHQQQHMPLMHGNDGTMTTMHAPSIFQQRQMFRMIQQQQQQNQYQSTAMQQKPCNNMQKKQEMQKYRGRSFNGHISSSQKFPPVELEHDEFSFVKDAMKLESK